MTSKKIAKDQPKTFVFNNQNQSIIKNILLKYPQNKKSSAVMPLLYLAQKQHDNWIPLSAIKHISEILEMSYIKVYEVATFYSMYNLSPVGKFFVQVCTTTPCMIKGSGKIVEMCKKHISNKQGEINKFTNSSWVEVECLGACVNAPMIQINDKYYEDLNEKIAEKIFIEFKNNKLPDVGSQIGRKTSEPLQNRNTLLKNVER